MNRFESPRWMVGRSLPSWEAFTLAAALPGLLLLVATFLTDTRRDASPAPQEIPGETEFVDPAPSPKPAAGVRETTFHDEHSLADGSSSPEARVGPNLARRLVALLESGRKTLEKARDFRGVLHKQERLAGVLCEPEELSVLMRREPRSVYLRWEGAAGRELLWRLGHDDGKLLLHPGGWKGRLTPMLKIEPSHQLVKALTRRPLEEIGLWSMGLELEKRRAGLDRPGLSISTTDCTGPDGRECHSFHFLDRDRDEARPEHITVVFVDRHWRIAVGCEVYGWPEEGETEPPLLEAYFYSQIEFNVGLSDRDFDPANPAYGFAQAERGRR